MSTNLFSLEGKIALVTGCNKGIGKGMALALAAAGADIIGVSANMPMSSGETEEAVKALGKSYKPYRCDFSNRESLEAFIVKVMDENPQIDILVNNAGTIMRAPAAEHSNE
jgi:2-deoxy-D-gluconate 3-dehydrogenase